MYYKCFFYCYTHYYENLFRKKKQSDQLKKITALNTLI